MSKFKKESGAQGRKRRAADAEEQGRSHVFCFGGDEQ